MSFFGLWYQILISFTFHRHNRKPAGKTLQHIFSVMSVYHVQLHPVSCLPVSSSCQFTKCHAKWSCAPPSHPTHPPPAHSAWYKRKSNIHSSQLMFIATKRPTQARETCEMLVVRQKANAEIFQKFKCWNAIWDCWQLLWISGTAPQLHVFSFPGPDAARMHPRQTLFCQRKQTAFING